MNQIKIEDINIRKNKDYIINPSYHLMVGFERSKILSIDLILLLITAYTYFSIKFGFNITIEDGELVSSILGVSYYVIGSFILLIFFLAFYSLIELLIVDNCIMNTIYAYKYLYKVENKVYPVSDECIFSYIREKYYFKIIILANTIGLFFLKNIDNYGDFYNYIKVFLISFIVLRLLFLNKRVLSSTKTFVKLREFFPYKEKDLEDELYFEIRNINRVTTTILIPITIMICSLFDWSKESNWPYFLIYLILYLVCSYTLNKGRFAKYYKYKEINTNSNQDKLENKID